MKKSLKLRGTKSVRHSGLDVACLFSTKDEKKSCDKDKVIATLLAMFCGLSREMLNQDMWFLAMMQARQIATEQFGVPDEDFMKIQERIFELQQAGKKSNPMNSMF